jgi:hypothetical protein
MVATASPALMLRGRTHNRKVEFNPKIFPQWYI